MLSSGLFVFLAGVEEGRATCVAVCQLLYLCHSRCVGFPILNLSVFLEPALIVLHTAMRDYERKLICFLGWGRRGEND